MSSNTLYLLDDFQMTVPAGPGQSLQWPCDRSTRLSGVRSCKDAHKCEGRLVPIHAAIGCLLFTHEHVLSNVIAFPTVCHCSLPYQCGSGPIVQEGGETGNTLEKANKLEMTFLREQARKRFLKQGGFLGVHVSLVPFMGLRVAVNNVTCITFFSD